jgi:outer membrane protein
VKQLGSILSIISLVGVIILFFLVMQTQDITESSAVEVSDEPISVSGAGQNVAVIEVDSLIKYYEKSAQMREELSNERIKYDNELSSAQRKLMADAEKFQRTASTMSNFEAQQRQKSLLEREQQLMQTEQQLTQRLAYSEALFSNEINDSLNAFLADYVQTQNFDVILSDNQAGVILWKRDAVNITQQVIDGMNARLNPADTAK